MTDELEAIRERHQEAEHDNNSNWAADHGAQAHFDRETLLRLLDANEIFRQLAERQEPLGADFEAAIGDLSTLYETDIPLTPILIDGDERTTVRIFTPCRS